MPSLLLYGPSILVNGSLFRNIFVDKDGSVVVSFNRLPALATAVSKQLELCYVQLISLTSSRLNLSTPAHLPDLSFCWSHSARCPTVTSELNPITSAPRMARRSAQSGDSQGDMHFTLQRKEVIRSCHLATRMWRHLFSVDKRVGQLRYRQDVLGRLDECSHRKTISIAFCTLFTG